MRCPRPWPYRVDADALVRVVAQHGRERIGDFGVRIAGTRIRRADPVDRARTRWRRPRLALEDVSHQPDEILGEELPVDEDLDDL